MAIIDRIKKGLSGTKEEEPINRPHLGAPTHNRYLDFLRRENNKINEQQEVEKLKQRIKAEDQKLVREQVFGIDSGKSILAVPNVFGSNLSPVKKKKEQGGFLHKSNL